MTAEPPSRRELMSALQMQILPSIKSGATALVPAHPVLAARVTRVLPQNIPLLRTSRQGRSFMQVASWPEEGFNAARYPTLAFVLEGEADLRLGITRRMADHDKKLSRKHGAHIVMLPTQSFFVIPPGVPFSDGSRPHWERPHLPDAHSHLLWFHVVPAGVTLHTCRTHGAEHTSSNALFLSETGLLPLIEALIEELQNRAQHGEALAQYYLSAFLLHLDRALVGLRAPLGEEQHAAPSGQHFAITASTPVARACRHIEIHFKQKLTLSDLAAQVYVSPAHLCRLFRAELNTTPGEYLTRLRLQHARSLLETTDLPIQRIGVLCGYLKAEHFTRLFRRHFAASPREYRRRLHP